MGGRDNIRGIVLQTIYVLLDATRSEDWTSVSMEPNEKAEKVDILFEIKGKKKAIQVKSSTRPISAASIKEWADTLKKDIVADDYELELFGRVSGSAARMEGWNGVKILRPDTIKIETLVNAAAYQVGQYLEKKGQSLLAEKYREIALGAMMEFILGSVKGNTISREDFDRMLAQMCEPRIKSDGKESEITSVPSRPNVIQVPDLVVESIKTVITVPYYYSSKLKELNTWREEQEEFIEEMIPHYPDLEGVFRAYEKAVSLVYEANEAHIKWFQIPLRIYNHGTGPARNIRLVLTAESGTFHIPKRRNFEKREIPFPPSPKSKGIMPKSNVWEAYYEDVLGFFPESNDIIQREKRRWEIKFEYLQQTDVIERRLPAILETKLDKIKLRWSIIADETPQLKEGVIKLTLKFFDTL